MPEQPDCALFAWIPAGLYQRLHAAAGKPGESKKAIIIRALERELAEQQHPGASGA